MPARPVPISPAYRAMVAGRAVLATVGGYALAALLAVALARALPRLGIARDEAAMAGTLAALVLLPVTPILVFCARSAWRTAAVCAGVAAGLGGLALVLGPPR